MKGIALKQILWPVVIPFAAGLWVCWHHRSPVGLLGSFQEKVFSLESSRKKPFSVVLNSLEIENGQLVVK